MIHRKTNDRRTTNGADIFDEDGNLDYTKIRAQQQRGKTYNSGAGVEMCSEWRLALIGETSVKAIASDSRYTKKTISKHASGYCSCESDVPPLRFIRNKNGRDGEWVLEE